MVEKMEFIRVTHVNSFGRPIFLMRNSLLKFSCSLGIVNNSIDSPQHGGGGGGI